MERSLFLARSKFGDQLRLLDVCQLDLDQRIARCRLFAFPFAFTFAWMAERSTVTLPSATPASRPCQCRLPATG